MVDGCGLICISSPEGDDNWFSRLLNKKDENGNMLIFSSMFSAVCEKCRNLSPTEMVKCKKIRNVIPKHKDKKKMLKYDKALDSEGLEDVKLRENYGQITRSTDCAFIVSDLEYGFSTTEAYNGSDVQNKYIKQIICTIDPNGGGKNKTAIWFGYLNTRTRNTVVSFSIWRGRESWKEGEKINRKLGRKRYYDKGGVCEKIKVCVCVCLCLFVFYYSKVCNPIFFCN